MEEGAKTSEEVLAPSFCVECRSLASSSPGKIEGDLFVLLERPLADALGQGASSGVARLHREGALEI